MAENMGRLTLGRHEGESIKVGDDLFVTLVETIRSTRECVFRIEQGAVYWEVSSAEHSKVPLPGGITLSAQLAPGAGKQARVTIHAPRSVPIMRTELLDATPRTPGPVPGTGRPVTP